MYCSKCGKELTGNYSFCPNCGNPVKMTAGGGSTGSGSGSAGGANFREAAGEAFDNVESSFDDAVKEVKQTVTGGDEGAGRLNDNRGLVVYIILNIITCGIYGYYFIYTIARDLNIACRGDGDETPGLLAYILLSFFTCGFYSLYWDYKIANRIYANAPRYGITVMETGTTVLLWYLIGALLCGIGPYVAVHFIIKNSNALFHAYNVQHGM